MGLADALRRLTNEELAVFFAVRPELADPPPANFGDLASRASTPYSLQACLAQLDEACRQVLDAVAYLGEPSTSAEIGALAFEPATEATITPILDRLRVLGLVVSHHVAPNRSPSWTLPQAMRRVVVTPFALRPPLAALLERYTATDLRTLCHNLGLPERNIGKVGLVAEVATRLLTPGMLGGLLDEAPADALAALRGIEEIGGVLGMDTRPWARSGIPPAIAWLLGHGLLLPANGEVVVVGREVSLFLRGGAPLRRFVTEPPAVVTHKPGTARDVRRGEPTGVFVDLTPLGAVDAIAQIGSTWQRTNPAALRSGGVAVRDVRATAKQIGVDDATAARLIEMGGLAGLLIADDFAGGVLPTKKFDEWLRTPPPERWRTLVQAWAEAGTAVSRVVSGIDRERGEAPLSPVWFVNADEVWRRARVIDALGHAPDGHPAAVISVARRAAWHEPGRWDDAGDPVETTVHLLAEASLLGIVHGRALSAIGRAALLGNDDDFGAAAALAFPTVVRHFTVQADLSAVAPAELDAVVASELALLADVESKGAATVYRFSELSLRRAFDSGRQAEAITAFLEEHARPKVPQPLRYLVDDVARRYGSLRLGTATAYVRSDDPVLIAGLLRSKKTAKLRLRQIAPTVVVSSVALPKLLVGLREAGFLPVEEDEAGDVVTIVHAEAAPVHRHVGSHRLKARAGNAWSVVRSDTDGPAAQAGGVIERLRAGESPTLL